jgi:glucokinase
MPTNAEGPFLIGVDLGGTKILSGVVDSAHQVLGRAKRATPAGKGEAALIDAIAECVHEARLQSLIGPEEIVGLGIGAPGTLDVDAGVVRDAPNLGLRDYPLGPILTERLGMPVLIRNDVRAGGYGEFKLGAGRGYRDLLAVFVGTGIGGCIIQDGQLRVGPTGNAGEIGHILAKLDGPRCGCGRKGCLEALASRTAIARRVAKAIRNGEQTSLKAPGPDGRLKSKELAAALAAGDKVATREVARAARALGLTLGGLVNLMAPEIIILGGGVTEALGSAFVDQVHQWARNQAMADPDQRVRIEIAALGDDAGLLGAALMAREFFAPSSIADPPIGRIAQEIGSPESIHPL